MSTTITVDTNISRITSNSTLRGLRWAVVFLGMMVLPSISSADEDFNFYVVNRDVAQERVDLDGDIDKALRMIAMEGARTGQPSIPVVAVNTLSRQLHILPGMSPLTTIVALEIDVTKALDLDSAINQATPQLREVLAQQQQIQATMDDVGMPLEVATDLLQLTTPYMRPTLPVSVLQTTDFSETLDQFKRRIKAAGRRGSGRVAVGSFNDNLIAAYDGNVLEHQVQPTIEFNHRGIRSEIVQYGNARAGGVRRFWRKAGGI